MKSLNSIFNRNKSDDGETQSAAATAVPSKAGSTVEKSLEDVGHLSSRGSEDTKGVDAQVQEDEEKTAEDSETKEDTEENMEYPTGVPLVVIIVGLCLAVLLVALVRMIYPMPLTPPIFAYRL